MKNPFLSALRVYVADLLNGSAEFTVTEAAHLCTLFAGLCH